jgi:8-amino-7-oxononanoate synthase
VTSRLDRIRAIVAERDALGLRRALRPRPSNSPVLDLAGNDYLGLANDRRVIDGGVQALREWGAGSTGSRLVTGSTELHAELEQSLAEFVGATAALVFSSGYLANLGAIAALGGPDVTVISDRLNHASIVDACRLSRSPLDVVPHRDVDKIEAALAARSTDDALVVTDAVFSVDGDLAPIAALHDACARHGALLVVDEAHAFGVVGPGGRGAVAAAGLADAPDIVRTVTLSKSLGAQGGAVLAAPEIVELLVNTARPFIFDTGLAPASTGSALAALRVLVAESHRVDDVRRVAAALAAVVSGLGVETVSPAAAVVPAFLGDPRRAFEAAAHCLDLGVHVGCFRPPSVPVGRSCLRMTARADLTDADVATVSDVLREVLT